MALPIMRARRAGTWPLGSPLTSCPPQNRVPRRISRAPGKERTQEGLGLWALGPPGRILCARGFALPSGFGTLIR
jgi:hypothetical protein